MSQDCEVTTLGRIRHFPQQVGHDVLGPVLERHHDGTAVRVYSLFYHLEMPYPLQARACFY